MEFRRPRQNHYPKSKIPSDENEDPIRRRKRETQSNRKMNLDRALFLSARFILVRMPFSEEKPFTLTFLFFFCVEWVAFPGLAGWFTFLSFWGVVLVDPRVFHSPTPLPWYFGKESTDYCTLPPPAGLPSTLLYRAFFVYFRSALKG